MAQHDRKDAQRLKERMRRAQGLYGMAASNVLLHRKGDKAMAEALEALERKQGEEEE